MAIDLRVTDGIDSSIEGRLLSLANAAEALDKRAQAAQRALNGINGNKLADIGSRTLGINTGKKSVESAYVTATKDLNKQRAEIANAIDRGFAERERQNAKIISQIEKASKTQNAIKSISIAPVATAATLKSQQKMYDGLFGAHNITTAPAAANLQQIIGQTTGAALKRASATSTKQTQQFYDNLFGAHNITTTAPAANLQQVIGQTTGTALKQASTAATQQTQQFYNNLFGAHNLTTTAPVKNLANTINNITGAAIKQSSATAQRAQQAMYNNLFSAVPTLAQPSVNTSLLNAAPIKAVTPAAKSAAAGVRELSSAMDGLNTSASFLRSDGLRWAKVLWALGGATLTAGAIVDAADAYTRLQNRLSVVAEDQAQVNALTEDMGRIANASRQPIEQTAKTFSRIDLAMKQMGRSQADSLVITENVAKALKLGGATAGEAASAMLQLSQAFNKGKLDGDEFRSVMENSPVLADALATQLKVTRGELLKLAPAGKITATVMADAFIGATAKINAAFDKLKPTIAESFTVLRSNMILFFGELDKQLGVTEAMSRLIIALSANLDVLTFAFMTLAPVAAVFVGSKLLSGFATMLAFAGRTAVAIGAIRNPIVAGTVALVGMARQAVATGAATSAMFTNATTRAVAFQLATVRAAAGVLALGGAARTAGVMLMSAFSFGNVLLMIATATAALIAFGDQMVVNAKTGATMRDMTIAAFQELGDFAVSTFNGLYEAAVEAFGGIVDDSQTTTERVSNTIFSISLATAVTFDAMHTVVSNFLAFLQTTIYFFSDTIRNVYAALVNMITAAVNVAIGALNALGQVANTILQSVGSEMRFGEIGYLAGRDFSTQFIDSFSSEMYGNKHLFADTLTETMIPRIKERADKRALANATNNNLRDYDAEQAARAAAAAEGDPKKKKDKKQGKTDEEKRADILKKVIIEQEKLTAAAKQYGDAREVTSAIEDVNGKLAMKNFALLNEAESSHIAKLVQTRLTAERVGKQMQDMYDNVTKPQQDYYDAIAAANNLLHDNVLTQEQHTAALLKSARAMKSATDPTFAYTEQLEKLQASSGNVGIDSRAIDAIFETSRSRADAGLAALTADEVAEIANLVTQIDILEKKQSALNSLWASTGEALELTVYNMNALDAQFSKGALGIDEYIRRVAALRAENGALNEQMFGMRDPTEPFRRGLYQLVAEMPSLGQGMADAIQSTLGNAIDNVATTMTDMIMNFDAYAESVADALDKPVSTLDVMRYALSDIINQIGKELINAVIKLGIQWAIQAALGKSIEAATAATTIATQTATAAAVNAAWTPAAISASIATMGSAATIGATSYIGAQATGKAASLLNFADGSDIIKGAGTSRSDSILANLSAGEMVMNREAVKNNYPMLRAMQSGDSVGGGYVDNSVHVSVVYNGDGSSSSEGDMNTMAKSIVGYVKLEVQNQLGRLSRQGQANYR